MTRECEELVETVVNGIGGDGIRALDMNTDTAVRNTWKSYGTHGDR